MRKEILGTDFFHALLSKRKAEVEKNILMLRSDLRGLGELEINDEGDFASISSDSYTDNIVVAHQFSELKEIDYALNKILKNKSVFGVCEKCHEDISEERLIAKPFAVYCKSCRDIIENNRK
jgi:DnaK suppressor protein